MEMAADPAIGRGLSHPDPLVRDAYLMAYDYIAYIICETGVAPPAPPCPAAAALRHAGDELLLRFPIFFRRWPRVFSQVSEASAPDALLTILEEQFEGGGAPGWRRRELTWSAVLSVYVLAGQMALHCHGNGMGGAVPRLQECVGAYVERVICPEIRERGGWAGFVSRFGRKPSLEWQVRRVCCWTLVLLAGGLLSYFLWKRRAT